MLQPKQKIGIDPQCNKVKVIPEQWRYHSLPTMVFEATQNAQGNPLLPAPITIDKNTKRRELLLTAAPTNTAPLWLGGEENRGIPYSPVISKPYRRCIRCK